LAPFIASTRHDRNHEAAVYFPPPFPDFAAIGLDGAGGPRSMVTSSRAPLNPLVATP
jgi:hypothetical protein